MSDNQRLKVVLCWHMHQPQYQNQISGQYHLPWVYLHAMKDYVDMAAHLEDVQNACAVVNFAPILLEQIDDYAHQIDGFLNNSGSIRDPLLAALASPVLPVEQERRIGLVRDCLRASEKRLINRFPVYQQLAQMARWLLLHPEAHIYIGDQFLVDLLVWYHLAWMGESVRRQSAFVQAIQDKARNFSLHDRRTLVQLIGEQLRGVIGRYRRLAEQGRVELSVTPYAHPIVPLLIDIQSAREAMPDVRLPRLEHYPGGEDRARWHIRHGIATFQRFFGLTPAGCWPSEGALSGATLRLFSEAGFRWTASGENVLRNSLSHIGEPGGPACMHQPYQFADNKITTFFRDDGLSDLIGFTYAEWHADDAVANLVNNLQNIAAACQGQRDTVVSIILDGENAWEYYPENGYYFLSALYRKLAEHPGIELTTFSRCLDAGVAARELPRLVAGSWVYGTFSTWIGDPDKNRAWDMLGDAKRAFDQARSAGRISEAKREAVERQLALCEGSDWFWWFGDYNPGDTVRDFDYLFRTQLTNLYQLLGVEPPQYLAQAFAQGGGAPQLGGVMRRGSDGGA